MVKATTIDAASSVAEVRRLKRGVRRYLNDLLIYGRHLSPCPRARPHCANACSCGLSKRIDALYAIINKRAALRPRGGRRGR